MVEVFSLSVSHILVAVMVKVLYTGAYRTTPFAAVDGPFIVQTTVYFYAPAPVNGTLTVRRPV